MCLSNNQTIDINNLRYSLHSITVSREMSHDAYISLVNMTYLNITLDVKKKKWISHYKI